MRDILIHYHIYKNARSSIDANLQSCLGPKWAPFEKEDSNVPLNLRDLDSFLVAQPSLLAISSHQLRPPIPKKYRVFPVVFLRHPLDRLVSIYNYERQRRLLPLKNGAPMSLAMWCEWMLTFPAASLQIRNGQAVFLSQANFERSASDLILNGLNRVGLQQARTFLEGVPFVGIVDRFSESIQCLQKITPSCFGITWKAFRENVSEGSNITLTKGLANLRDTIGALTYYALEEQNRYDLDLYEQFDRFLCDAGRNQVATPSELNLPFTGERFIPADPHVGEDTQIEHRLRYEAVAPLLAGKVVLDAASGEGYGANIIARYAAKVIGIEIDAATVAHAQSVYGAIGNLDYKQGSIAALPFPDCYFDTVVSFETIEHVSAEIQKRFVAEVYRVLKSDGLFVVSTPNRINYSDRTGYKNEYS